MQSFRSSRLGNISFIFALLLIIGLMMPSSFVIESAGPALDVNSELDSKPLVSVSGVITYPTESQLYLTTVSSLGSADAGAMGIEAFGALFSSDYQLYPVRALYPQHITASEVKERNTQMMQWSQDSAAAVAFDLAGYDVTEKLTVVAVSDKYPSGHALQEGDVLTAVRVSGEHAFTELPNFVDLSAFLSSVDPGTKIDVKIMRDGAESVVSFATIAPVADSTGWVAPGSMAGVSVEVSDLQLPGDVVYAVDNIGGPSAGVMFTLGIYDVLTEGSLGGSASIAGTGEIAWDGDVSAIGGIVHKLHGAAAHGATDFLAPATNCAETIGHEPEGMRVWAIRTASDAVAAVQAIAANDTSNLMPCTDLG